MAGFMTKINRDEATRKLQCDDYHEDGAELDLLAGQSPDRSQPSTPLHIPTVTTSSFSSTTPVSLNTLPARPPKSTTVLSGNGSAAPDMADVVSLSADIPVDELVGHLVIPDTAASGTHTRSVPVPTADQEPLVFSLTTPSSADEEPTIYTAFMADFMTETNRDEAIRELSTPLHSSAAAASWSSSIASIPPETLPAWALKSTMAPSGTGGEAPDTADIVLLPADISVDELISHLATPDTVASGTYIMPVPAPAADQEFLAFPLPTPTSANEEPTTFTTFMADFMSEANRDEATREFSAPLHSSAASISTSSSSTSIPLETLPA
ncbi:uncharacterized protein PHACADRAFT_189611 [Phanerochaete carnosa HHB-10118-sp]|uniref:Uncharacterized protein n=1 Tax=Phanerochaete carnosa (strain HHB-10118-sp) TaxID=650164 RepID=K5VC28_PHACS|nr:uncharacterized protein PHACADRAFT_189611 [Phanerochaete carnosa HHB-10118-sp]EKM60476.1 hypothetical protein PHACADRAFT_189611 [Phanerochaete carnosa HHB-10118-sp]